MYYGYLTNRQQEIRWIKFTLMYNQPNTENHTRCGNEDAVDTNMSIHGGFPALSLTSQALHKSLDSNSNKGSNPNLDQL